MNKYIHIIYGVYEHKVDDLGNVTNDRLILTGDKRDLKDFLKMSEAGVCKILQKLEENNGLVRLNNRSDFELVEIQPLYVEELEVTDTRDIDGWEDWKGLRKVLKE